MECYTKKVFLRLERDAKLLSHDLNTIFRSNYNDLEEEDEEQ